MAIDESCVIISFRLNPNREEDIEIQRFMAKIQQDESYRYRYGDKSKFIKSTLIKAIKCIEKQDNEKQLISEMNTQRGMIQKAMNSEADRIINELTMIVRDEAKRLVGTQTVKERQEETRNIQKVTELNKEEESVNHSQVSRHIFA